VILFTACQGRMNRVKEKLNEKIKVAEQEITTDFSEEKRKDLIVLYMEYLSLPKDSLTAEYLLKCGQVNMSIRRGEQAISNFTNLIKWCPNSEYVPQAYFYIAYVYEDIIYDIIAAEAAYMEFLEKYPDHELADDARLSIKYLGKSPEELYHLLSTDAIGGDSVSTE